MNLINSVIILVSVSQSQATSQYLDVPDEFECAKNKTKRSGLFAIDVGNNCCEGLLFLYIEYFCEKLLKWELQKWYWNISIVELLQYFKIPFFKISVNKQFEN